MPIGKNAIKRVENNGYSNVASSAPDMENSVVAEPAGSAAAAETPAEANAAPAAAVKPRRGRPAKAKLPQMQTNVAAPAETTEKAKPAKKARKTPAAPAASGKDGFERVELGGEMPYWLL